MSPHSLEHLVNDSSRNSSEKSGSSLFCHTLSFNATFCCHDLPPSRSNGQRTAVAVGRDGRARPPTHTRPACRLPLRQVTQTLGCINLLIAASEIWVTASRVENTGERIHRLDRVTGRYHHALLCGSPEMRSTFAAFSWATKSVRTLVLDKTRMLVVHASVPRGSRRLGLECQR